MQNNASHPTNPGALLAPVATTTATGSPARVMFTNLDGTLLGPGGSLLAGSDPLAAAEALVVCRHHGIEVVLVSGRKRSQLAELTRLLGLRTFIAEAGALLVADGVDHWIGSRRPWADKTVHRQIAETGAVDRLLQRFPNQLKPHTPWSEGREASHLFRGGVDLDEAARVLQGTGTVLVDDGVIEVHDDLALGISRPRELHAYHLLPLGASKAAAAARLLELRGLESQDPPHAFSVGDSLLDLELADLGLCFIVGNGVLADPRLAAAVGKHRNARVTQRHYGAGVLEAVDAMLTIWER